MVLGCLVTISSFMILAALAIYFILCFLTSYSSFLVLATTNLVAMFAIPSFTMVLLIIVHSKLVIPNYFILLVFHFLVHHSRLINLVLHYFPIIAYLDQYSLLLHYLYQPLNSITHFILLIFIRSSVVFHIRVCIGFVKLTAKDIKSIAWSHYS